jgi:phage-related protein
MKALHWIGACLSDIRRFPISARAEAGTDLRLIQQGVDPRDWKPMPDIGAGVREIRVRTQDGAFRVFYVVESATDVYVLHAFQKKSQRTSAQDIAKGRARYKLIP